MSGFYSEEASPWASQVDDGLTAAFDAPHDEVSPWGDPSEVNSPIDDSPLRQSGVYDPYSYDAAPLVANNADDDEFSRAGPVTDDETGAVDADVPPAATPIADEPTVPELKPARKKPPKSAKKNRAGNLKVESVESDPLAASTVHLSDVNLSRASGGESAGPGDALRRRGADEAGEVAPAAGIGGGVLLDSPVPPGFGPAKGATSGVNAASPRPKVEGKFEISVSDPAKVGDLANAYTEYTVQLGTDCAAYDIKESAVQRRYRDFRWLYRTLEHTHPGVVVPAVPGKQALGRFNDDFVQQRRAALETMLRKMVAHPLLYQDPDLIAFLTSTDFGEYLRTRLMDDETLQKVTHSALHTDHDAGSSNSGSGSGSGFIGTLSGALSLSRGAEVDPWTVQKRKRLDEVEEHLRAVSKDLVAISIHRQQLSDTLGDLSSVLKVLSEIEATQRLSKVLRSFSKVHDRLAAIYARQRQQNLMTLEATLDEHTRTIGSIRDAISARQRIFSEAESVNAEYERRQASLDKFRREGRVQDDRDRALDEDAEAAGRRAAQLQQKARDVAQLVESEIARVHDEKIVEFRNAVEIYLETTIEAQKESIELWETFYSQNFASKTHT